MTHAAKLAGKGVRSTARVSAKGAARVGFATGRAAHLTFRTAKRATEADGAASTGLSRMIVMHAVSGAGDAAVAISLAGTLFFQVPTAQARGQVALFLGLTMLPFVLLAPLIGPVLDRFAHGRRWAIGSTMALRAFLCWVLADAVVDGSAAVFPAALGCLVASKAYNVARAAAVPLVLPEQQNLVRANSRISLAAVVGTAVSAPLAAGAAALGSQWSLRYGFVVFVAGTVLAILLPAQVDSSAAHDARTLRFLVRQQWSPGALPRDVVSGLRCNTGLRLLSGFLIMFMAFLLRDEPFEGWQTRADLLLALVIGSAGVGSVIGLGLGSLLRRMRADLTVILTLVVDAAVVVLAAVFYSLPLAVLLGLTAGLAQSLGKLSLDSIIQEQIPERDRSGTFARSETVLQLAWVLGGFVGITVPLIAHVGLGIAAAIMLGWTGWVLVGLRRGAMTSRQPSTAGGGPEATEEPTGDQWPTG